MPLITGTAATESLYGGQASDTIAGLAGNDFIDAGAGDDSLSGGDGEDNLQGGAGNDAIDGGAGARDAVSFQLPAGTVGKLQVVGGGGADFGKQIVQLVNGASVQTVFVITRTGAAVTVQGVNAGAFLGVDTLTNVDELRFAVEGDSTFAQFTSTGISPAAYAPVNPAAHFTQLPGVIAAAANGFGRAFAYIDLNLDGVRELLITQSPSNGDFANGDRGPYDGVSDLNPPILVMRYDRVGGLTTVNITDRNGAVLRNAGAADTIIADFNGDGRDDLIFVTTGQEVFVNGQFPLAQLELMTAAAGAPVVTNATQSFPNVGYASGFPGSGYGFWHSGAAGDINGDGRTDIVLVDAQGGDFPRALGLDAFLGNGQGGFTFAPSFLPVSMTRTTFNNGEAAQRPSVVQIGDFNGDGRADLVWGVGARIEAGVLTPRENRIFFNTGSGFAEQGFLALPLPPASVFAAAGHDVYDIGVDRMRLGDINGDGLQDIAIFYVDIDDHRQDEAWGQVWIQNPDHSFTEAPIWPNNQFPHIVPGQQLSGSVLPVDVNGDGLLDIMITASVLPSVRDIGKVIWMNMGDGTYRTLDALAPTLLPDTSATSSFYFQDLDADGQAELVVALLATAKTSNLGAYVLERGGDMTVAPGQAAEGTIFADRMIGTAAADTVAAGLGADSVATGAGYDSVSAGAGNDTVDGGEGLSYLRGDAGNDLLQGGSAFDDINGNMGNDTVSTGAGEDYCVGGKDNDSLSGGGDYDLVYGNLGNDTCDGGEGNDIVRGGQDNDIVLGGAGNDFVSGDKGADTMTGGAGADIFHTFGDAGIDRVSDFNLAEGDRVQLDPGTLFTVAQIGADTVISMTGGGQMILVGVAMTTLTGNWIFGA